MFFRVGGCRGGLGVAETIVGVGGGVVEGVSDFTTQFPFGGLVTRFVAVAARSERRVLSPRRLPTLDFTTACPYSGFCESYLAQTGTLEGVGVCLETLS
jgi:hypothetical protein